MKRALQGKHLINLICHPTMYGTYFINPHIPMGTAHRQIICGIILYTLMVSLCFGDSIKTGKTDFNLTMLGVSHLIPRGGGPVFFSWGGVLLFLAESGVKKI